MDADRPICYRFRASLGGNADTQAAIAGGIAEAYWGPLKHPIVRRVERVHAADLLAVVRAFAQR